MMVFRLLCLVIAFSCASGLQVGSSVSRRNLLSKLAAASAVLPGAAHAVSARTGLASVFTGEYDDPNHPDCLRSVKVVGGALGPDGRRQREPAAYVKGADNPSGGKACAGETQLENVWKLTGKVNEAGDKITIDFSPKEGPKDLVGTWDGDGIFFPDGNKWTKVPGGTPSRRPKAVTLNSGD